MVSQGETSDKSTEKTNLFILDIFGRGDWLGNPGNIKVENNGAVGYVGNSLSVHNTLFYVHKL